MAKPNRSVAEILAAARAALPPPPAPPKPLPKKHELSVASPAETAIYGATVQFWQTVVAVAQSTLPPDSWDVIICDLMDNGDVAATPAQCVLPFYFPRHLRDLDQQEPDGRSEHFRFPKEWEDVSLHIALHQNQLEEATERCDDDAEYDREFQAIVAAKVALLRRAAGDASLSDVWNRLPQFRGAFAVVQVYEFHEANLLPLIGELPQPAPPTTALEAFSRLLHHAHDQVGKNSNLKFSGEELVGVDLSGANTTDATLELLDQIPNLPALCQHLREIILAGSYVTEARVAKLTALLPHVKVLR